MATLLREIPSPILGSLPDSETTRTYTVVGSGYDVAIDGQPFSLKPTSEHPVIRQTAPVRKEQSDTSRDPGEHSLAFWWIRAQSSSHGGAGQKYNVGGAEQEGIGPYRYLMSKGVDVFSEPGVVSVLPSTGLVASSSGTPLIGSTDDGRLFVADGTSLKRYTLTPKEGCPDHPDSPMDVSVETVAWGGTEPILSLTTDGSDYYLATATGVYNGTGLGAATKQYAYTSATPLLAWVKQRLILGLYWGGATFSKVYELDSNAEANTALPTQLFAATKKWRWTGVAETPSAILISGHNGQRSAVYRMSLKTDSATPTLLPGVVSAQLPPGELVLGLASYLGTVVGLNTSLGFRVGMLGSTGDFQYGPILVEHKWGNENGAVVGIGDSFYAGWTDEDGSAGLVRVCLADTYGSGAGVRHGWAPDLRGMTVVNGLLQPVAGKTTGVVYWRYGRKAFAVPSQGVFVESKDNSKMIGEITSSRIRWDTLEPKLVRFARIRGEAPGSITLSLKKDKDDTEYPVTTIDLSEKQDSGDVNVYLPPCQWVTVKTVLAGGARLTGTQLKALPAQRRQRFISLPLACYDRETLSNGRITGGPGTAAMRLLALESLEQTGAVVQLQWLTAKGGREYSELVVVEEVQFEQTVASGEAQGWGGMIYLTLRTVE